MDVPHVNSNWGKGYGYSPISYFSIGFFSSGSKFFSHSHPITDRPMLAADAAIVSFNIFLKTIET